MTKRQIDELVAQLALDLDARGICHACLSFITPSFHEGDVAGARRWARRMTPWIWDDGLRDHAMDVVRRAKRSGVPRADEALEELLARGAKSPLARAMVMRLGAELAERERRERIARLN